MATKPLLLIINLEKRTDRLEKMRDQLKGLAYCVVKAVSGDNLDDTVKGKESTLSDNEKGCISSHIKALEIFLNTDNDTCCILEDDVLLGNDFYSIIKSNVDFPKDSYVLKLETMGHQVWVEKNSHNFHNLSYKRLYSHHYGTAGYITSRSGANFIIQALSRFDAPADDIIFLNMLSDKKYGKCLQLDPACCMQEHLLDGNNESDIYKGREKRLGKNIDDISIKFKKKIFIKKAFRECKRLKKQIAFCLNRILKISSRIYTTINFKR